MSTVKRLFRPNSDEVVRLYAILFNKQNLKAWGESQLPIWCILSARELCRGTGSVA